jgi:hypothetical protein
MALTPLITTEQTLGSPSIITINDDSTGTDVAVVTRRVYVTDKDGEYYVEDGNAEIYTEWDDFPDTLTLDLDILTQDRALNIRVDWLNISDEVLYTLTVLQDYTLYAKTYFLNGIKAQSENNSLKEHANFYYNLIRLLVSIKEADDSVTLLSDITSSQAALNRAKQIVDNPSYLF